MTIVRLGLVIILAAACGRSSLSERAAPGDGDTPGGDSADPTPSPWYANGWAHRRMITVTGDTSELVDIPVAAHVPNSLVAGRGSFRVIADDQLTELTHEVELGPNDMVLWVKIPSLPASGVTFWLYYDNDIAPPAENSAGVWSSGFRGVWHFDGVPTDPALDASASLLANPNGPLVTSTAITGNGYGFDGTTTYLTVNSDPDQRLDITGTTMSLEAWVRNRAPAGQYRTAIGKEIGTSFQDAYVLSLLDTDNTSVTTGLGTHLSTPANIITDQNWHYVVATRSDVTLSIFVDGVLAISFDDTGNTPIATDTDIVYLGGADNGVGPAEFWGGALDEIRIASVPRNPSGYACNTQR